MRRRERSAIAHYRASATAVERGHRATAYTFALWLVPYYFGSLGFVVVKNRGAGVLCFPPPDCRCSNDSGHPFWYPSLIPPKLDFFLLQDAECLPREILAIDFFGIDAKRVAQFIAGGTVETCVIGIQLGAELGAVDFVPAEEFTRNVLWVNNAQPQIFFVSVKVTVVV